MSGDSSVYTTSGKLLMLSGQRTEMLLKAAQDSPPQPKIICPKMSIVLRLRNPELRNLPKSKNVTPQTSLEHSAVMGTFYTLHCPLWQQTATCEI